jgi:hypothetical protein
MVVETQFEGAILADRDHECIRLSWSHHLAAPLLQMNTEERLVVDYTGTGLTVGKHPMAYCRYVNVSMFREANCLWCKVIFKNEIVYFM